MTNNFVQDIWLGRNVPSERVRTLQSTEPLKHSAIKACNDRIGLAVRPRSRCRTNTGKTTHTLPRVHNVPGLLPVFGTNSSDGTLVRFSLACTTRPQVTKSFVFSGSVCGEAHAKQTRWFLGAQGNQALRSGSVPLLEQAFALTLRVTSLQPMISWP